MSGSHDISCWRVLTRGRARELPVNPVRERAGSLGAETVRLDPCASVSGERNQGARRTLKQEQSGSLGKNRRQATGQGKTQGDGHRPEDHGEYPFAGSEPKWSDRSPLNSGFTAPRASGSACSAGQPIGDSTCTRSCAPTAQGETMHPARIGAHEVKRGETPQKQKNRAAEIGCSQMHLRRSGCGLPASL